MLKYDIVGIGNSVVDMLANVGEDFLDRHSLAKGTTLLVGGEQAADIYKTMPPTVSMSGGCVANTMAGMAILGSKTAFIGKVGDDEVGNFFAHDLNSIGVDFSSSKLEANEKTGKCLVFITPDKTRTMATNLGASKFLSEADVHEHIVAGSKMLYLEAYLWDFDGPRSAMKKALKIAKKARIKVAMSLSDKLCVQRNREEFVDVVKSSVDILFGNEEEIKSLFKSKNLDDLVDSILGRCEIIVITCGSKGSFVITDNIYKIKPSFGPKLVDTTGAGDLYASGFLYGVLNNYSPIKCGNLASLAAGEVIKHIGARPDATLKEILKKKIF